MFLWILVRAGIPPGTPTLPCQGAVLSGGMISHHAEFESNAARAAVMETTRGNCVFNGTHVGGAQTGWQRKKLKF